MYLRADINDKIQQMNNVYCYPYYLKKYFSVHYIMCCVQCTVVGKYSIHSQHFFNIRECEMNNVSWRDCFRALVDMMPSELGPGNNQPSKSDRSHHINPTNLRVTDTSALTYQINMCHESTVNIISDLYMQCFFLLFGGDVRQGWGEIGWRDCMPSLEGCRVMPLWLGHSVPDDWAWCTLTQTHMHTLSWGGEAHSGAVHLEQF